MSELCQRLSHSKWTASTMSLIRTCAYMRRDSPQAPLDCNGRRSALQRIADHAGDYPSPMPHTNTGLSPFSALNRRTAPGTSRRVRWRSSPISRPGSLTVSISGFQPRGQAGRRWRSRCRPNLEAASLPGKTMPVGIRLGITCPKELTRVRGILGIF